MKTYLSIIFSLILLATGSTTAKEVMTLSALTQASIQTKFPNLSCTIRLENSQGTAQTIEIGSVAIEEMNHVTTPTELLDNHDGTYTVNWVSKLQNRTSSCTIYAGTASCTADYADMATLSMPLVRIITPNETPRVYFPKPALGDSTQMRVSFRPTNLVPRGDGSDIPVRIDSIKTHTPYFTIKYLGNYRSWNPPPFDAYAVEYPVFLYFHGTEDTLYTDKFSVYYNGGQVVEVDLISGAYNINAETILSITKPLPGDTLTPCFGDTIKWTGAVSGLQTYVEFSSNGGITWRSLGSTKEDYLYWTVPAEITEEALIRVYQKFSKQGNYRLMTESGYTSCAWSNDASHLAATTNDGYIHEWTVEGTEPTLISETYPLKSVMYPDETAKARGLAYYQSDGGYKFAGSASSSLDGLRRDDNLVKFTSGSDLASEEIYSGEGRCNYNRLDAIESEGLYLTLEDGDCVLNFNSDKAGSDVEFSYRSEMAIRDFKTISGRDSVAILRVDNRIVIYDIAQRSAVDTLDFSSERIIDQFSISPNGKLIAIATMVPPVDPNYPLNLSKSSDTHIIDIETMKVARSYFSNESAAIGLDFNPASNKLVRASRYASAPAHVMLYDLTADVAADFFNFYGDLVDYAFAQEGHNVAVVNEDGVLTITQFVYTESAIMNGYFSIRFADIAYDPVEISPRYIDTRLDTTATAIFRNNGVLPLLVSNMYFKYGTNFTLLNTIPLPDTLAGGEKYDINFVYNPIDTGIIVDTLYIETCAQKYAIPFISRGLPRNIEFCSDIFNFGEVCIGTMKKERVKLFRNLDPVPLNVNFIYFLSEGNVAFSTPEGVVDTIIAPGEYYYATIGFIPTTRGENLATCHINHSKQGYMVPTVQFRGIGLGADVEISHQTLLFIPEIPVRTITLRNLEATPFDITGYTVSPEGSYRIVNSLPANVSGNTSYALNIECLTDDPLPATLTLETYPCIAQAIITLSPFSDNATVTILDTEADPRERATIKISSQSISAERYRGERFFDGEILIDKAIFLPDSVYSNYGSGTITRNEVVGDKRHIGFRITGDFPAEGIIAEIHGYAGLTLPTESSVTFDASSAFYGRNVSTETANGTFKLINLCGDKIIVPANRQIQVTSIYPNPASDAFTIEFESDFTGTADLEILSYAGYSSLVTRNIEVVAGKNSQNISISALPSGTFTGILRFANGISSFTFIKTR